MWIRDTALPLEHARIQKIMSEGVLLFLVWWGGGGVGSKYHYKRANIGPPAKRYSNCVSLACKLWPNIESGLVALWFLRGSGPVCPSSGTAHVEDHR